MTLTAEVMHPYRGQWVHCHSIYGVHQGIITQVLEHGIILSRCVQLASGTQDGQPELTQVPYPVKAKGVDAALQFFPIPVPVPVPVAPAVPGGMFFPYGGINGIYPYRPRYAW